MHHKAPNCLQGSVYHLSSTVFECAPQQNDGGRSIVFISNSPPPNPAAEMEVTDEDSMDVEEEMIPQVLQIHALLRDLRREEVLQEEHPSEAGEQRAAPDAPLLVTDACLFVVERANIENRSDFLFAQLNLPGLRENTLHLEYDFLSRMQMFAFQLRNGLVPFEMALHCFTWHSWYLLTNPCLWRAEFENIASVLRLFAVTARKIIELYESWQCTRTTSEMFEMLSIKLCVSKVSVTKFIAKLIRERRFTLYPNGIDVSCLQNILLHLNTVHNKLLLRILHKARVLNISGIRKLHRAQELWVKLHEQETVDVLEPKSLCGSCRKSFNAEDDFAITVCKHILCLDCASEIFTKAGSSSCVLCQQDVAAWTTRNYCSNFKKNISLFRFSA